jgi:hypothetical protein
MALNEDWGVHLDGKQIQRWSESLGKTVVSGRDAEVRACEQGRRPASVPNPPSLLVIGMDGGRVQTCEKQRENDSRWREDKVGALTSYLPGDGTKEHPPQPLVTTHLEAERRGRRQAQTVLVMGDGGNWIDPLSRRERLHDHRIVDYYHAVEHLYEAARAAWGKDAPEALALAEQLKDHLWDGHLKEIMAILKTHAERLGPPQESDGPDHPRRVLANNVGYFERHRHHMEYPKYRARGWPIGSGVTESAVKLFNKRVKGTEQFWSLSGAESILALRALWLSQDGRWDQYWNSRPAYSWAA